MLKRMTSFVTLLILSNLFFSEPISLLSYCSAWISGNGCVPINHLMEDAATAEIARVQLWQWVRYAVPLASSGAPITVAYIDRVVDDFAPKVTRLIAGVKDENVAVAATYLKDQIRKEWASEFLTSDLMGELQKLDGVAWVKSAL
jgi:malate synthase